MTDLIASLREQHQIGAREIERVRTGGQDEQLRLATAATDASQAWQDAKLRVAGLQDAATLTERRKKHFDSVGDVGAGALEAEQAQEGSIRASHALLQHELQELENRAQGIVGTFAQRHAALNERLSAEEIRLGAEEVAAAQTYSARVEELREQEEQAQKDLRPPARIEELGREATRLRAKENVLKGEQKNPAASDETLQELAAIQDKLPAARGLYRAAEKAATAAREALRTSERARDDLLRQHERAGAAVETARSAVHALEQQLRPPAGSLLAFMRAAHFNDRSQVAKVLDPQLLLRTDLQPQEVLDAPDSAGTALAVGSLALELRDVTEPDWLEAASVKEQLQCLQESLAAAEADLKAKVSQLQAANGQCTKASTELAQREGELAARATDVERLERTDVDLRATAANEVAARKAEIAAELAAVVEEIGQVDREAGVLREEHAAAAGRIKDDFRERRRAAARERDDTVLRVAGEKAAAQRIAGEERKKLLQREDELKPLLEGQADHLATLQRGRLLGQWFEGAAADSINALHIELNGVLAIAAGFVTFLDTFDRKVGGTNTDLRNQLASVKAFPAFRDLDVHIRSSVRDLDYLQTLREMKALSESQVSMSRFSGRAAARQTELPGQDVVALMRSFRDLLNRDSGIRANLSELVRLECSLTINGKALRITDAEEFKRHASNGTTGMIVGMFLMGFAGVVRKRAAAPVRVTWITDEVGRFDSVNLQVFLKTLDENNIDVISARPEADPSTLDLFDTEARFGINGKISTARLGVDEWEAQDVVAA